MAWRIVRVTLRRAFSALLARLSTRSWRPSGGPSAARAPADRNEPSQTTVTPSGKSRAQAATTAMASAVLPRFQVRSVVTGADRALGPSELGVPADQPARTEHGRARVRCIRGPRIEVAHASVIADRATPWQTAPAPRVGYARPRLDAPLPLGTLRAPFGGSVPSRDATPSFCILLTRVVGLRPRLAAAPAGP